MKFSPPPPYARPTAPNTVISSALPQPVAEETAMMNGLNGRAAATLNHGGIKHVAGTKPGVHSTAARVGCRGAEVQSVWEGEGPGGRVSGNERGREAAQRAGGRMG